MILCQEHGFLAPVEFQVSHKAQERPLCCPNPWSQAVSYGSPTQEDWQGQSWGESVAKQDSGAQGQETYGKVTQQASGSPGK